MNKWRQIGIIIGTGLVVYLTFRFLFFIILPILIAIGIGRLLHPVVRWLQKRMRASRGFCVLLPVLLFYGVVGWALYYLGGNLLGQALQLAEHFPCYQQELLVQTENMCSWCDRTFQMKDGNTNRVFCNYMTEWFQDANGALGNLSTGMWCCVKYVLSLIGVISVILLLTCLLLFEYDFLREQYRRCRLHDDLEQILHPLTKVGAAYARAQLIIISIVSVVSVGGFYMAGSKYAILFGIGVAILDAFPILGSGIVFIPLIIYELFHQAYANAVIYLVIYILAQVIRQFLEPKLIGDKMGISPFYIVVAVYLGMEAFGVAGVILGPMALVLWRSAIEYCLQSGDSETTK